MFTSAATSKAPNESIPTFTVLTSEPIIAFLVTLLSAPPVPPLPNRSAFGPLKISTCSTL